MARPKRNFYSNGRMATHYRLELVAREVDRRAVERWTATPPAEQPSVEDMLALALAAGLNAYIVPSHGRLLCEHPRGPYPTTIRTTADIERLAALVR